MWQWASITRCGCVVAISVLSEGRPGLRDPGLPLLVRRIALRRHQRGLGEQPRPRRRVELDDLELERRRRLLEVDLAGGVQRAAGPEVHLHPVVTTARV